VTRVDAPTLAVRFRPRAAPLAAVAAAARGPAAVALAARLLARDDAALAQLEGVAGPGLLLILGAAASLPWIDGVVYLGRDPAAPSLLLPTALEPDVPLPLFELAVLARAEGAPIAVLVDPPALVLASAARPILRATLSAWVAGAS
jgi:hypothetical protein